MSIYPEQLSQQFPLPPQTTKNVGQFNGGSYKTEHRDTNTLLCVMLQPGGILHASTGSMVAMSPQVQLKGKSKFSLKKMFVTGGEMRISTFTGPGEVLLAPPIWGDIIPLHLNGSNMWEVGKDNFLAMTDGVIKETKSQGLGKALFSGEGLFVHHVSGQGLFFIHSLGAIVERHLQPNEQWIVDNGHLVAWNCAYVIERASSEGIISNALSGEGLVCRFTGPGTVYIQTRNPATLAQWMRGHGGTSSNA